RRFVASPPSRSRWLHSIPIALRPRFKTGEIPVGVEGRSQRKTAKEVAPQARWHQEAAGRVRKNKFRLARLPENAITEAQGGWQSVHSPRQETSPDPLHDRVYLLASKLADALKGVAGAAASLQSHDRRVRHAASSHGREDRPRARGGVVVSNERERREAARVMADLAVALQDAHDLIAKCDFTAERIKSRQNEGRYPHPQSLHVWSTR